MTVGLEDGAVAPGCIAGDILTMRLAMAVTPLGLSAVAVPVGAGHGIPQAVEGIGPRYREDLCLDDGQAIEIGPGIPTPIDPREGLRRWRSTG